MVCTYSLVKADIIYPNYYAIVHNKNPFRLDVAKS
jgi:hypothetical protein